VNRDLDAAIEREIFGWQLTQVGPDYDGHHACEILAPGGIIPRGLELPRRGPLHVGFLCRPYSSNWGRRFASCQGSGTHDDGVRPAIEPFTACQIMPRVVAEHALNVALYARVSKDRCRKCGKIEENHGSEDHSFAGQDPEAQLQPMREICAGCAAGRSRANTSITDGPEQKSHGRRWMT
jgi:hypothetical protein